MISKGHPNTPGFRAFGACTPRTRYLQLKKVWNFPLSDILSRLLAAFMEQHLRQYVDCWLTLPGPKCGCHCYCLLCFSMWTKIIRWVFGTSAILTCLKYLFEINSYTNGEVWDTFNVQLVNYFKTFFFSVLTCINFVLILICDTLNVPMVALDNRYILECTHECSKRK